MQLAATDLERRDIGGALSDAISNFDDAAPFVKLLNVLGPWSGVIDGLAQAIYSRAIYIAEHRVPRGSPRPRPPAPAANGMAARPPIGDDEIFAPNPGGGFGGAG